jgi:hypothetical protein
MKPGRGPRVMRVPMGGSNRDPSLPDLFVLPDLRACTRFFR